MSGKPGLRDVARVAKVSLSTASRALAQPGLVSPEVRARIEQVCVELRYIPNRTAKRLSVDRSDTIGVIVPSIANPLFAPAIDGVRTVLDARNFGMLINSAELDPLRELKQVRTFLEHGVDAILTLMPVHDEQLFELLEYSKIPAVFINSARSETTHPFVEHDNFGAMRAMAQKVIDAGHREIAIISGPRSSTPIIFERTTAALETLAGSGVQPSLDWMIECDYDPVPARAAVRALLTSGRVPTALVCTGDQHAAAAVIEAQALGLRVPEDISVTGCNDVPLALLCEPQLTTVRLPYRELGETACRLALEMLEGNTPQRRTLLPYEVIERGSLGRPRTA
ncbi:LacI family DNA-binding transcriptional regulator [Cereibacter sp. SYSU M97828]|nr:LacI family DNA-binding transcriptional regulator [Cereibacter flavus]